MPKNKSQEEGNKVDGCWHKGQHQEKHRTVSAQRKNPIPIR